MEQVKEPNIPVPAAQQPSGPIVINEQFSLGDDGPGFDPADLFGGFSMAGLMQSAEDKSFYTPEVEAPEPDEAQMPEYAKDLLLTHAPVVAGDTGCDGDPGHKPRRTKGRAGDVIDVNAMLAIPTDENYQYAISSIHKDKAHLQPLAKAIAGQMSYRNGKLYYHGRNPDDSELARYHDSDPDAMADIDLPLLYSLYSQVFYKIQKDFKTPDEINRVISDPEFRKYSVSFFAPEFMRMIGLPHNMNQGNIDRMIDKIDSFHHIMGLIPTRYGFSHYPALFLLGHDAETNRVEIISPYFNQIIMRARRNSYKIRNGQPKRKNSSLPAPIVSTLVKASITSEKNKNAVEMVYRIVSVIERAGSSKDALPHINARELVSRCEHLTRNLEGKDTNHRNTILRRAFTRAWELLKEQTILEETYLHIQFPFPEKMPTYSKLDKVTFEFPHEGKIKSEDKKSQESEKN